MGCNAPSLARQVISAYAEGIEGLSNEDCDNLNLSRSQCETLQGVLGGQDRNIKGIVTKEEEPSLEKAGFSKDFINELRKDNGTAALQRRVRWLADNCLKKFTYIPKADEFERIAMIGELGTLGEHALPAIPALIKALEDETTHDRAISALATIGKVAVPYLLEALKDPNPMVRKRAAYSLGAISPPPNIDGDVCKVLATTLLTEEDIQVCTALGKALERIAPCIENQLNGLPILAYLMIVGNKTKGDSARISAAKVMVAMRSLDESYTSITLNTFNTLLKDPTETLAIKDAINEISTGMQERFDQQSMSRGMKVRAKELIWQPK